MLDKINTNRSKVLFKRKKRDYHVKSLKNPFYFKTDKRSLKKKFNSLLIAIILLALIYFVAFTNFFKIENINITGGANITRNLVYELAGEQQNERWGFLFKQNKLPFFKTNALVDRVREQIILETIIVEKDWRNSININIVERFSDFYLLNQGQVFTLDSYGNLISILEVLPTTTTLPVLNYDSRNLVIGEQVTDRDFLDNLKALYNFWQEAKLLPEIQYIDINENYKKEFKVHTSRGFDVFLSREYDLSEQLESYKNLYISKIKDSVDISYVDLRVRSWIYYK